MPVKTYQEVLSQVERLSPDDQLRLVEQLAGKLRREIATTKAHRITELKGVGKELWEEIDVQQYIDQERDSWNG